MRYTSALCAFCLWLVIAGFPVAAQTETYQWSNVAMGGGGFVSGIIPSKTQQGLFYARTDVGGAYRWDAANEKWIPLLDWVSENETGYLGVESIATDPVDPAKVYLLAGTSYFNGGKTAILRSSDYGATFTVTDVTTQFKTDGNGMGRQTGEKLQVDPNSPGVLYCGTRANGLFRSLNAGAAWSRVTSLNVTTTPNGNGISFVALDPSSGAPGSATQTIIAGISQTGTNLYRSDNAGNTFTAITGGPVTLMPHRAVITGDKMLYVTYANAAGPWDISGAGQIWKYNMTTKAWTNVTPSPFGGAFGGISADPANPLRLVASSVNSYLLQDGSYGDRIFLSTNGGASWIDLVARGFKLNDGGISWINGNAIHWAGCVEFDPFDTKKAWIISGNGIWSTDDIDATQNVWTFRVRGIEETVPQDLATITNGPLMTAIGDYDGFIHTDVKAYPAIYKPTMGTTTGIAVAPLHPNRMLRTGSKMYYSNDGGGSWTQSATKGANGNLAISADGKTFLHSPGGSGSIYRSRDDGATWTAAAGISVVEAKPVADPVNPAKFYAYNPGSGAMMVSKDSGATFVASGIVGTGGAKRMRATPGREGDLWVALAGGGLSHSVNSGLSFTKISSVAGCSAVGLGKAADGASYPTLFIWGTVNSVTGVFRSTDQGVSWKRINDDAHEYGGLANGQFVSGDPDIFGRVYMSTAGRGVAYGESSLSCTPDPLTPGIRIGQHEFSESYFTEAAPGDTVTLRATGPADGSWSWSGPAGFTGTGAEITLEKIGASSAGMYTLKYSGTSQCESGEIVFVISVALLAESIEVSGVGGENTIDQFGGTLQMMANFSPAGTRNQDVVWSISKNEALASIDATGLLTALGNGTVTVRATAQDGSGVFGEADVVLTHQLGPLGTEETGDAITLYPNPSSGEFTISTAAGDLCGIEITDARGSLQLARPLAQATTQAVRVDLAAGVYFCRLISPRRVVFRKLIVR